MFSLETYQIRTVAEVNTITENYLMKSLIHYCNGHYLHMESLSFEWNWMFEPYYSKSRAMIVYIEHIKGTLNSTAVNIKS